MCFGNPNSTPVDPRGLPLDMSLARNPARVMRENPFGMGPDYDASPRLNQPIRRGDGLDFMRGPERADLGEMVDSDFPMRFDANGFDAMNANKGGSSIAQLLRLLGGV